MSARILVVLGGLMVLGVFMTDLYLPALPDIADGLGGSDSATQLTLTGCLIGLGLGQLTVGTLSDTLGRRGPLLCGLVLFAVSSLGAALAPSLAVLDVTRVVQGFAGGTGMVLARAIVSDEAAGLDAGRAYAILGALTGVGPILAPTLGAALLVFTDWRGVFVVLALAAVPVFIAAALWVPPMPAHHRRAGGARQTLHAFGTLLHDARFLGYAIASGFAGGTLFAYISGSSFVLQDVFGLSPQLFAVVFAGNGAAFLVTALISGRVLPRFGHERLLSTGLLAQTAASAALLVVVLLDAGLAAVLVCFFVAMASNRPDHAQLDGAGPGRPRVAHRRCLRVVRPVRVHLRRGGGTDRRRRRGECLAARGRHGHDERRRPADLHLADRAQAVRHTDGVTDTSRAARALSFGAASDDYDRFRPGPPAAVLDWLLPAGATDVVDLGAGTGALTRLLVHRVARVTAVEPDPGMRRVLVQRVPAATALEGTAEALPVADAGQDAVLGASMWHWVVLPPRATAEAARVLRPGGRLGVLWTHPDREIDWVDALWATMRSGQVPRPVGQRTLEIPAGVGFAPPEGPHLVHFSVTLDRDDILGLVGTYSGHLVLDRDAQADRLARVAAVLDADPRFAAGAPVEVPMVCHAWLAAKL